MKKLVLVLTLLIPVFIFSQIINIPDDYPTIQQGIDAASDGDTVLVNTGTYFENINFLGKAITVSSHYLIENDSSHIYNTVINGSQPSPTDSACVVLFNTGEDTTSVLNGFTITGGSGCFYPIHPLFENLKAGGGIQIINCGAKITHNIVTDNHITNTFEAFGGGIHGAELPEDRMIIIEDNLVSNNSVTGNIWAKAGGIAVAFCHTRICNNIVKSNTVTGDNITQYTSAGGIWYSTMTTYVCDVLIEGNEVFDNVVESLSLSSNGTRGGGIEIFGQGSNINPIIKKNLIYNNKIIAPDHTFGNGIIINKCDTVAFTENIIHGNTSESPTSYGGGLCIRNSHLVVSQNLIYNNTSTHGGGIYVGVQSISEPHLFNNTISGNNATVAGGGVYLKNVACSATNNIVWNNTAPETPGIYIESGTIDLNYSLVEDWDGAGTGNINEDPIFVSSGEHPYQINDYSPCIDAGDTTGLKLPEYDLAGEVRIFNERVDMGAYERNYFVGFDEPRVESEKLKVDCFPNPFATSTYIEYTLNTTQTVTITFYNQFGKQLDLIEVHQPQGVNKLIWTPKNLADGIYYFRLQAGEHMGSGKIMLMR